VEIRVDKLRNTLNLLKPVILRKTTLPVLKDVLLSDGKAIASDLETTVYLDFPEAEDKILIPHSEVSELLKFVPGDEKLTIERVKKGIRLSWEGGKASYPVPDPIEYPKVTPDERPVVEQDIDGNILVKALSAMAPYAADEDSRPVLHGITLYLGGETAAAAGDGFRMVYETLGIAYQAQHAIILPLGTVKIISEFWDKTPPVAELASSLIRQITAKRLASLSLGNTKESTTPTWASLRFGRVNTFFKLIQGNPPNFKALIPVPAKKVQVMAPDFERAVLRLRDIAKESSGIVRLVWTEKEMTVLAKSEETGEVEATVSVNAEDGPGRIGMNVEYVLEYLKGKEGLMTFGITTESSPVLFQHPKAPITVVMPMMVQW
jgi:DNA polymerase III sliding clamp (beta) subunit (PCNA family)